MSFLGVMTRTSSLSNDLSCCKLTIFSVYIPMYVNISHDQNFLEIIQPKLQTALVLWSQLQVTYIKTTRWRENVALGPFGQKNVLITKCAIFWKYFVYIKVDTDLRTTCLGKKFFFLHFTRSSQRHMWIYIWGIKKKTHTLRSCECF
jgi:hypothetical protein